MVRGFDDIPGSLPDDDLPEDFDIRNIPFGKIAEDALENLSETDVDGSALWRDHFALAGEVRTFFGGYRIKEQWALYARERHPHGFTAAATAMVVRPAPGSSWIDVPFSFLTRQRGGLVGNCSGTISFLPRECGKGWKVWMLKTLLENFEGHGNPDDPSPIFKQSKAPAGKDQLEHDVSVLIVGAGQSGLSLAGRLGALGISHILLEKADEVGYSWTGKYDAVRQHTVREMNNLPFYRTYKASDPTLLPAKTVAEGFQNYVKKYRINIWLAAKVESCLKSSGTPGWIVHVAKGEQMHVITTRHIVLSMGASQSVPKQPEIDDAASFRGTILNIGTFKNSSCWKNKKGIVVGSATGAHDAIYNLKIPPQVADRIAGPEPHKISREILKSNFRIAFEAEKERFDALERVGFHVDRDTPLSDGVLLRLGGYYIDVGTSARIAKGDIKVKSRDAIKRFVGNGLEFESGDIVEADVVVFATGYERDPRLQAASIVGTEVAQSMVFPKGFDEDGELDRIMLPSYPFAWLMGGAVSIARWNSRFIALQIQAEILGHPFPNCQWGGKEGRSEMATKL